MTVLDEELRLKHLWKQANGTRAFAIHHPQHGEVGYVVGRTHGDTFDLQNVMLNRGADASNVNALGPAAVRHLGRQLRHHTGARYVTSDTRQTGMRAKLGGSRIVPRVRIGESIADALIVQKLLEAYRPRMPLAANRSFFYKERHATRQASWISPTGEEHRMAHHGAEGHLTWLRDNLDKVAPNLRHPQAEKMAKLGSGHPRFDYQPFDRTSDNMVMGGWIRKAHKDAYQVAPGNEQRVLDHVRARHPDVEHLVMDVTDDVAQRYGQRTLRTKSYRYDVATGRREEL